MACALQGRKIWQNLYLFKIIQIILCFKIKLKGDIGKYTFVLHSLT